MINIPILKKNFREHICLWGIVTAVLILYLFLLLGTYAPDGKAGVILLFSVNGSSDGTDNPFFKMGVCGADSL